MLGIGLVLMVFRSWRAGGLAPRRGKTALSVPVSSRDPSPASRQKHSLQLPSAGDVLFASPYKFNGPAGTGLSLV